MRKGIEYNKVKHACDRCCFCLLFKGIEYNIKQKKLIVVDFVFGLFVFFLNYYFLFVFMSVNL